MTIRSYLISLLAQLCLVGLNEVKKLEEKHQEWLEKQVREICKIDVLDDLAWSLAKSMIPRIFQLMQDQIDKLGESATELEKQKAVASVVQQIASEIQA